MSHRGVCSHARTDDPDIVLFENGCDLFPEIAGSGLNKKDHALFLSVVFLSLFIS
jgi:hypothetical protein